MNMIRHIHESHIIQSPTYAKLTNKEKNDLHAKLLHSTMAANTSYNKIANRAKSHVAGREVGDLLTPLVSYPTAQNLQGPTTRARARRELLFHGDFTPKGSDHKLEIEIFEN
ncbi:TPA: hypothetical protein N0F65_010358 [Lagenidium giganteum]|uniref:Uncharacterized protein n=1 Tax=Lagenidium giganteum TaxID=4803 RepID=A0AAV2Z8F8_9STRA|nr:TPA: hypothetical protein N0F65_010358 [Lagenidium giganteum]